jgi:5-methyltetrahydrofolate--homocysteine methyltransferase
MMLRGSGWKVTDIGVDISPDEFCSVVADGDFDIVGLSSLLTMSMVNTARTITALETAGLRDRIKVMVGGAPTSPDWAAQIKADAYAKDGPSAARIAAALVAKSGKG